jgi:hypothetical protein
MEASRPIVSFIVRITVIDAGRMTGTVERVSSGERHRFQGADALARIIAHAVDAERREPDRESGRQT